MCSAQGHALPLIEDDDFSACTSSFTSSPLADGEYTFAVRATNSGGTDATPAKFEFELDTDAPDGVIVQAPSGDILDHTPEFQVSTDEPDDISEGEFTMTCQITGSPPQSIPCDEDTFEFPSSLPDGDYTFTLQVQDLLGRTDATPATATFSVITPPPVPTLTGTDPGSPSTDTTPLVQGTAEAGSTVRIFTEPTCTPPAAAQGSAAQFASPGSRSPSRSA